MMEQLTLKVSETLKIKVKITAFLQTIPTNITEPVAQQFMKLGGYRSLQQIPFLLQPRSFPGEYQSLTEAN